MTGLNMWQGTCPTTGKRMFADRARAKAVSRQLAKPRPSAYRCDHCSYFHLGHNAGLSRADHRNYHGSDAA